MPAREVSQRLLQSGPRSDAPESATSSSISCSSTSATSSSISCSSTLLPSPDKPLAELKLQADDDGGTLAELQTLRLQMAELLRRLPPPPSYSQHIIDGSPPALASGMRRRRGLPTRPVPAQPAAAPPSKPHTPSAQTSVDKPAAAYPSAEFLRSAKEAGRRAGGDLQPRSYPSSAAPAHPTAPPARTRGPAKAHARALRQGQSSAGGEGGEGCCEGVYSNPCEYLGPWALVAKFSACFTQCCIDAVWIDVIWRHTPFPRPLPPSSLSRLRPRRLCAPCFVETRSQPHPDTGSSPSASATCAGLASSASETRAAVLSPPPLSPLPSPTLHSGARTQGVP